MPDLLDEEVTATYAGLRAATDHGDYLIDVDAAQRYLLVGGIRSTGLTAGMAIAEHVRGLLAEAGLDLADRDDLPPPPRMPNLGEAVTAALPGRRPDRRRPGLRHASSASASGSPPARSATPSPRPSRRPTSTGCAGAPARMNGRCQGFFCGAAVERPAG